MFLKLQNETHYILVSSFWDLVEFCHVNNNISVHAIILNTLVSCNQPATHIATKIYDTLSVITCE
jgi:hypothetical protein